MEQMNGKRGESFLLSRGGLDPSPKSRSQSEFLDENVLKKEGQKITQMGKELASKVEKLLKFPNKKTKKQWDELSQKDLKITNARIHLQNVIRESPLGNTIMGTQLSFALEAAAGIIILNDIEGREKIANRNEFPSSFKDFFDWGEFSISAVTILKIGQVSIKDVMSQHATPSLFFRQRMEADAVKSALTHEKILEENHHIPLANRFPNWSKERINEAAGQIIALSNVGGLELFDRFVHTIPIANQEEKELVAMARRMVKRFDELKRNAYNTILDPASSEFPELKKIAMEYLIQPDQETRIAAILTLGLTGWQKEDTVSHVYRTAKIRAQGKDQNSDFYSGLEKAVLEFIEEAHLKQELLTKNDTLMFLDEPQASASEIPRIEDLGEMTNYIFQKQSKKEYYVDPKRIIWNGLVPPTAVAIGFPRGTPHNIDFVLHYENKEGERIDFVAQFDTKKNEVDWSFLEDPNDPEMKEMRNAIMLATKEILLEVQRQAEQEWQEKQKTRNGGQYIQSITANGKKKKSETPYVPKEKEGKPEKEKLLTPFGKALLSETPAPFAEKVKRSIVLPREEEMQKMLNGISPENQTMIYEKIEEFNEKGTGKFKALPGYRTPEDKKVYELRTRDYRVLLTEKPRENDKGNRIHEFEIYKIGDRKEIFKRKQKE